MMSSNTSWCELIQAIKIVLGWAVIDLHHTSLPNGWSPWSRSWWPWS